jgi:hypothetical protein
MIAQVSQERMWGQIVARAWSDEDFKQRLLSDPQVVLAEYGMEAPAGIEFQVVEDTPTVQHLVLPASPEGDLTDEELVGASVADSYCRACGGCGRCGCGCRRC